MSSHSKQAMGSNVILNGLLKRVNFDLSTSSSDEYVTLLQSALSSLATSAHSVSERRESLPFDTRSRRDRLGVVDERERAREPEHGEDDRKDVRLLDVNHCGSLIPLILISEANGIDLGRLAIKEYHSSNLSLSQYLRRSSLFGELAGGRYTGHSQQALVDGVFRSYLQAYADCVELPIPNTLNQFVPSFQPFDDDINVILEYMVRLNQTLSHVQLNYLRSCSTQIDVYFAPPSAGNDLSSLTVSGMIKSSPNRRLRGASGVEEIFGIMTCSEAQRLFDAAASSRSGHQRYVLLIARNDAYDSHADTVYLWPQAVDAGLSLDALYTHNEVLWKLNTKRDLIPGRLNVDSAKYGSGSSLFSLSYHLHPLSRCAVSGRPNVRSFAYFSGYGQQICRRDVLSKWRLLFVNGKNSIAPHLATEYKLDLLTKPSDDSFGEDVFGLSYQYHSYKRSKRQTLTFPKETLQNTLEHTAEFNEQQQLYYYLTWSCKMQLIDAEFLHYTLKHRQPKEIAIFNTELHLKHDPAQELYLVAVLNDKHDTNSSSLNKPKWKMANNGFMTKDQVRNIYGIDHEDLPKGSRAKHGAFQKEMAENLRSLSTNFYVRSWHRIEKIYSQKYKQEVPRLNDNDLNKALRHSIEAILDRSGRGDKLEMIPILNIDTRMNVIRCESLIPIKVKNKWFAVAFKSNHLRPTKLIITGLYIDVDDIINKCGLVCAANIERFQWLKGEQSVRSAAVAISRCSVKPVVTVTPSAATTTTPTPTLTLKYKQDSNESSNTNPSIPSSSSQQAVSMGHISQKSVVSQQTDFSYCPNDMSHKTILSLQQQLNEALQGNKVWLSISETQKNEINRLNQQLSAKDQMIHSLRLQLQHQQQQQQQQQLQLQQQVIPAMPPCPTPPQNPLLANHRIASLKINTSLPKLTNVGSGNSDSSNHSAYITNLSPMPSPLLSNATAMNGHNAIPAVTPTPIPTPQITVSPIFNNTNNTHNGFPSLPLQNLNYLSSAQLVDTASVRSQSPPTMNHPYIPNAASIPFLTPPNSVMNLPNYSWNNHVNANTK